MAALIAGDPSLVGGVKLIPRGRPSGLSLKLGALGFCLPRALPPMTGISYVTERKA